MDRAQAFWFTPVPTPSTLLYTLIPHAGKVSEFSTPFVRNHLRMPQVPAHIKVSQFGPWNREAGSSQLTWTQFWWTVGFKFYVACQHQWQAPKTSQFKLRDNYILIQLNQREKEKHLPRPYQYCTLLLLRLPHFAHQGATQVPPDCKLSMDRDPSLHHRARASHTADTPPCENEIQDTLSTWPSMTHSERNNSQFDDFPFHQKKASGIWGM